MGQSAKAFEEWTNLLGSERILTADTAQALYGQCTTGVTRHILGALKPEASAQVAEVVTVAARHRVPLYPISTGRNWGYGTALPVRDGCVVLDLSGLNRIHEFDPETGLVTLEPGVTQGMLSDYLLRGGHGFMVPVTGAGPDCSIVGNALERGYGITPHADHFSAVTCLEAVLPDGSLYQSALTVTNAAPLDMAFKWGVGPYVDGLFTQSGLGIVTRMTIALARRPEAVRAFLFGVADEAQLGEAVTRVREVLARYPGVVGAVNLMNAHRMLAMSIPYPRESLGRDGLISPEAIARLARENQVMAWTGFGTLYGSNGVVAAAQKEIRAILRPLARRLVFLSPSLVDRVRGAFSLLPAGIRRRFQGKVDMLRRSLELVEGRPNETALPLAYWRGGKLPPAGAAFDPARDGCGLIWYAPLVPMKGTAVMEYLGMVERVLGEHRFEPLVTLTSISERCFDSTVPILFDRASDDERRRAESCYWALMEEGRSRGFLPYRVGVQTMEWLSQGGGTYWQTVRRIKAALDPDGLFAPGRYI